MTQQNRFAALEDNTGEGLCISNQQKSQRNSNNSDSSQPKAKDKGIETVLEPAEI
ncbi:hypothetical protein A2U01_0077295, partial [Trifolium medium]|nr:hypothetical protein [Trifolium medium]